MSADRAWRTEVSGRGTVAAVQLGVFRMMTRIAMRWLASRKDILKMIEAKDAYAWVDRYCRANKSGDTADAVDELVKDLQKR